MVMLAVAALVVSFFAVAQSTLAASVEPNFMAGNPTCESLGLGAGAKIDQSVIQSGEHTYTSGDLTITITSDADKKTFSFKDADPPISAVIVKAGDGANVYEYDSAVTADSDLITPDNDGGQQAGLSHFEFCLGEAEETPTPTPTPTPEESVSDSTSTPEQSVEGNTGTPEQSVAAETGTPAASIGSGAISSESGATAIPVIAFAVLMLISLGGLAAVNLAAVRRNR